MDDSTKESLNKILGNYGRSVEKRTEERQREKTEHEQYLEDFGRVRQDMIRPLMEGVCAHLQGNGHRCRIEEREEKIEPDGRLTSAAQISMIVYPAEFDAQKYSSMHTPEVSLSADTLREVIHAHCSALNPGGAGSAGSIGNVNPSEITKEWVERKIVEGLAKIFKEAPRY